MPQEEKEQKLINPNLRKIPSIKINRILTEEIDKTGRVTGFSETKFALGKKLEATSANDVLNVCEEDIRRHLKGYRGNAMVTITTSRGTFKKQVTYF